MSATELPSLGQAIRLALRLDEGIFTAVQSSAAGLRIAIIVVVLASLSEALGQSVILFINRVRPWRFVLALAISTVSQLVGYGLWVGSVWLLLTLVFRVEMPIWAVASTVGLAYAPQLFAFFELTPFLGNPFGLLLSLWSMLAIIVAINAGPAVTLGQAVLASSLGWASIQVWRRSLGRPVYALGHWMARRAAGAPLTFKLGDIPRLRRSPKLLENVEHWRQLLTRERLENLLKRMAAERDRPRRKAQRRHDHEQALPGGNRDA